MLKVDFKEYLLTGAAFIPASICSISFDGEGDDGGGDDGGGDENGDDGDGDSGDGDSGDSGDDEGGKEGGKGAEDTDWATGIEDKAVLKLANRYTSRADQAAAHHEAVQELSKRIKIPGEKATDDEKAAYRKALGVPETAEGYEFDKPEHMEDDEFKSEEVQGLVKTFADGMHAAGTPPHIVKAAMDIYWEMDAASKKAIDEGDQEAIASAEAALRKKWGKNYDQNVKFSDAFLEKQGASELGQVELKDGTLLGSHPDFIELTATAGRRTAEGSLQVGLGGTEAGADLQKRADKLRDEEHAASAAGNMAEAERINKERKAVLTQIHGEDIAA